MRIKACSECGKEFTTTWKAFLTCSGPCRLARERRKKREWRQRNPASVLASKKKWRRRNPRAATEEKTRRRKRHPEKNAAYRCVERAVLRGKLSKPAACPRCGRECEPQRMHAHHEDYSQPLNVEWMCFACHRDLHREAAS